MSTGNDRWDFNTSTALTVESLRRAYEREARRRSEPCPRHCTHGRIMPDGRDTLTEERDRILTWLHSPICGTCGGAGYVWTFPDDVPRETPPEPAHE